jgi:hypothetical protein
MLPMNVSHANCDDGNKNHGPERDVRPRDDGVNDDHEQNDEHLWFLDEYDGDLLHMMTLLLAFCLPSSAIESLI